MVPAVNLVTTRACELGTRRELTLRHNPGTDPAEAWSIGVFDFGISRGRVGTRFARGPVGAPVKWKLESAPFAFLIALHVPRP